MVLFECLCRLSCSTIWHLSDVEIVDIPNFVELLRRLRAATKTICIIFSGWSNSLTLPDLGQWPDGFIYAVRSFIHVRRYRPKTLELKT